VGGIGMGSEIWKSSQFVEQYLSGVRGAIPLAQAQIDIIIKLVEATSLEIKTFLDIGCGDGILSAAILDKHPKARGVLLDFSKPMIEAARNKLKNFENQLVFVDYDYGKKDWLNHVKNIKSFTIIISGFSIHHQDNVRKQELYAEIFEVLEPGGMFINLEHVLSQTKWLESIFENYFIDSQLTFNQVHGNPKTREELAEQFFNRADQSENILTSVEKQCEWLRKIGYQDVDCYFKVFELAIFGGRKSIKKI
jgi:ubiquinone/menaquinone biosynthesis C-methylase UbiE